MRWRWPERFPEATRVASFSLLLLLAAAFLGWVVPADGPARPASWLASDGRPLTFAGHIRPLFEQYCGDCHIDTVKGGLNLDKYPDAQAVKAHRPVFEAILKNVEGGIMPPENKPQPSPEERFRLVGWLKGELYACDCTRPDPGRVTLRRLNRTEYNNTIRDLVGLDLRPADDFPEDDTGYGFDNIGDVLSVPPVLVERYLAAAEKVLDAAIVTGPKSPAVRVLEPAVMRGGAVAEFGSRVLASQGEIAATVELAEAGEYRLRVRAFGDQAGPERVKMAVRLDDRELGAVEVRARRRAPEDHDFNLALATGAHEIRAAFLNDYYRADDPNPNNRDRNLHVVQFELTGPFTTNWPPLTSAHRRIFIAQPESPTPAARRSAAEQIVLRFAARAFRRPPAAAEVGRLMRFYDEGIAAGDNHEQSVKLALQAVLVSPRFLFREEPRPDPNNPRRIQPVDEFALASRLSYFLWSTMPDDELFALAERGQLRRQLPAQVRRLLRDPRADALVTNFAGQWLQLRNLEGMAPDEREFPGFSPALRAAMREETEWFVRRIVREDRSVLEFLDADWTYVDESLARHYGLEGVHGTNLTLVSLRGTPRGGLLTQASVLTLTSNPTRTSPVKRGKWVLENLLNTPPPPAPPSVPLLEEGAGAKLSGSLRQRMEQHRADPLCASCHALMDPIGFGLENFDGVGRWREQDGAFPIDPAGQLNSGEAFQGPAELKQILLNAKREEFLRCLAAKLLTYALGRGLEYYDQCAVEEIARQLRRGDYRVSALVLAVVNSVPFQMQRGERPPDLLR
jgi:hypothetical protein